MTDMPCSPGPCLFDSGLTWRLHAENDGYTICMRRGKSGDVYQMLQLSPDFTTGSLYAPFELTDATRGFLSMDGALFQLWASFLLTRHNGAVLHALGVKRDGQAHLFMGPSGAGKSTLAQLIADADAGEILSDDRIIVRQTQDTVAAYGTPWNGDRHHHTADLAPICAIYFLTQAPVCALTEIPASDAAARLFASASVAGWPVMHAMQTVLAVTSAAAKSARRYQFGFTPDNGALEALGWR